MKTNNTVSRIIVLGLMGRLLSLFRRFPFLLVLTYQFLRPNKIQPPSPADSRPRPPPPLFHPSAAGCRLPVAVSSGPQKASKRERYRGKPSTAAARRRRRRDEEPAPCDEAPAAAPAPDRRRDPRRLRHRRGAPPRLLRLLRQLHLHRLTPRVLHPGTGFSIPPLADQYEFFFLSLCLR